MGRTIAGGGLSEVVVEEEGEDVVEGVLAVAMVEAEEEGEEDVVVAKEGVVKRGVGISGIEWRSIDGSQTLYGGMAVYM